MILSNINSSSHTGKITDATSKEVTEESSTHQQLPLQYL